MANKDIKPIELCIEAKDVVKRYPITDAMEIVRCKNAIFFHSTCFWVVSKPTLANNLKGGALFETLRWYCDYMDSREEHSEEERETSDTYATMIVNALTLPIDLFTDSDFMLDISDYIVRKRNEYYERLRKEAEEMKEETMDDAVENANFEGEVRVAEELTKELSELAKQKDRDA